MNDRRNGLGLSALGSALDRLADVLREPEASDIVRDATIQRFEFTYEIMVAVMRRALAENGVRAPLPTDVFRHAYQHGWIADEQEWLRMMRDRTMTSHIYREDMAIRVAKHIRRYEPMMRGAYELIKAAAGT